MGGVILARPDDGTEQALLFDPLVGWLIIANRMHDGRYAWAMRPVRRLDVNPGPAARVLRNTPRTRWRAGTRPRGSRARPG
jgi:hypothetical protein